MLLNRSVCARIGYAMGLALAMNGAARGDILYVDDDAPGGDGSSWALAFTHLQDALAAAQPGSEITEVRVGQGLYRPDRDAASPDGTGDRTASFSLIPGVTLAGGFAGFGAPNPDLRDIDVFETALSGDLAGDDTTGGNDSENAHHVARADFLSAPASLNGVTVRAGNTDGGQFANGGGLRIAHSAATVIDCTFIGNRAHATSGAGGAIAAGGGPTTIERCTFVANRAVTQSSATAGGGALWIIDETHVIDCVFSENSAWNGGAVFVTGVAEIRGSTFDGNTAEWGGAIFRREFGGATNDLQIVTSLFHDNSAGEQGGAVYFESGDIRPRILNSRFIGNQADASGGAIAELAPAALISNCIFAGNTATQSYGGAITTGHAGVELFSCTIVGNTAGNMGGGLHQFGENPPDVINTIFWGNADASGVTESAQISRTGGAETPAVRYCVVEGLSGALGGTGNFDENPLFADADGPDDDPLTFLDNDYRLLGQSPCVDAGHNWGESNDEADLDGDSDREECTPRDVAGGPRFTDCAPVDRGCGMPVVVDIGAHEASGEAVNPIRLGDVDGDGRLGFDDLIEILSVWGEDPANCLTDIDLDGKAGYFEVLFILRNWD